MYTFGSPAESVGRAIQKDLKFAHAKVRNPDVSLVIQENIVQFQISAKIDRN